MELEKKESWKKAELNIYYCLYFVWGQLVLQLFLHLEKLFN